MRRLAVFLIAILCMVAIVAVSPLGKRLYHFLTAKTANIEEVRARIVPRLEAELAADGFELGQPVFLRIFKEESELEVWLGKGDRFERFKTYEICNYSGALGPKLKEGDRQSPEGFYKVGAGAMNPNSSYHLSFNLGFPNLFDQAHERSGSFLMVHGNCVSIGCYAMTDAGIEEIYLIVEAAQNAGQTAVPVHAFPFRMTNARLAREQGNTWFGYWQNLKQGYDLFETSRVPPEVSVMNLRYVFADGLGS